MKENIIQEKSYQFALKIIELHQKLKLDHQYEIASQLLKSRTSIGANVEEAIGGQSRKDFLHKISIAYKEARETKYWLRLLKDSGLIDYSYADAYLSNIEEIIRILGSIQITVKSNS